MKILSLTSIRSDYDLMSRLYRKLSNDDSFEFGIVVAGVHQSEFHNFSREIVAQDALKVVANVFNFETHDGYIGQVRSASNLLGTLGEAIEQFAPDVVFVIGDREDALMMSIAASYMRTPIIHFYGGDHASDGHIDNQVRHAISKLATFHFVSTETHRDRLISIGEEERRIKVVGSIAIDNLIDEAWVDSNSLFEKLFCGRITENDKIALFLYHPIVEEIEDFKLSFEALLDFLVNQNLHLIIGKSNNDPKFLDLSNFLNRFRNHPKVHFIDSLERNDYINLLRSLTIMIGNSSAGLLEMATFKVPVVNIGMRQRGRYADKNVIFSELTPTAIEKAVTRALSPGFRESLMDLNNSYGSGGSVEKAIHELHGIDLKGAVKKKFDPLKSPLLESLIRVNNEFKIN